MVQPKYFDVTYSINPWMNPNVPVNMDSMKRQWELIYKELVNTGIPVELLEPQKGLNDMTFAANAGMIHNDVAIVSKFRDKERQGEESYFKEWFLNNAHATHTLRSESIWEGEACSIFLNKTLVASYSKGGRANKEAYQEISEYWGLQDDQIHYVNLVDPYFYHLDVCLCKLTEQKLLLCPLAFTAEDNKWLQANSERIIQCSYDDALNFACNAFVYEDHIFLSSATAPDLLESLNDQGFTLHLMNVSEFIKSGGGVKCLIFEYNS